MKHHKIYYLLFFISLGLLSIFSCGDNHDLEEANTTEIEPRRTDRGETMPSYQVRNDILYFRTADDLNQMYRVLSSDISSLRDEKLEDYIDKETTLGHKSLYVSEYTKGIRNADEEYTTSEIINMLESDYINDPALKLILNKHYEVGIGKDVIVFFNQTLNFTILNGDAATIQKFRDAPKGVNEVPWDIIDENVIIDNDYIEIGHETNIDPETDVDPRENFYTLIPIVSLGGCTNPFDITVFAFVKREWTDDSGFQSEWVEADYELSFGDGGSRSVPNALSISEDYTYNANGNYAVKVDATFMDEDGVSQTFSETLSVTIGDNCSSLDLQEAEFLPTSNNQRAISVKLWFNQGTWAWSTVGAFTHAYKWKANKAKWVRDRAELSVETNAEFLDGGCSLDQNDDDTDDCNNCKKVQKKIIIYKSSNRRIQNGGNFSEHNVEFDNGQTLSHTLVLNPC